MRPPARGNWQPGRGSCAGDSGLANVRRAGGSQGPAGVDHDLLELPVGVARSIRADALRALPRESCGLLLGRLGEGRARVRRAVAALNRSPRADRFLISPADVWAAIRRADREGWRLIGAYHSHPGTSAEPSGVDAREAWGELLQLIVACDGAAMAMRCWRPSAGGFAEVQVAVLAGPCEQQADPAPLCHGLPASAAAGG